MSELSGWVDDYDLEADVLAGTYHIDGTPVAGYMRIGTGPIQADVFMHDEMNEKRVLFSIEGRNGPFDSIETAKAQLQMIARPALGAVMSN